MLKIDLEKYGLKTSWIGKTFSLFDVLGSTNECVKENIDKLENGTVIGARFQENGKGRGENVWYSEKDKSLLFSLVLKTGLESKQAVKIVFITALALKRAIKKIYGINPQIKWPNDIYINNKKCAGILSENIDKNVIIGVGLNVNQESFKPEINNIAASLLLATGKKVNIFTLLAEILNNFEVLFERFLEHGFNEIVQEINESFYLAGKQIEVKSGNQTFKGTAHRLGKNGELVISSQNSETRIPAGEVHVCL